MHDLTECSPVIHWWNPVLSTSDWLAGGAVPTCFSRYLKACVSMSKLVLIIAYYFTRSYSYTNKIYLRTPLCVAKRWLVAAHRFVCLTYTLYLWPSWSVNGTDLSVYSLETGEHKLTICYPSRPTMLMITATRYSFKSLLLTHSLRLCLMCRNDRLHSKGNADIQRHSII